MLWCGEVIHTELNVIDNSHCQMFLWYGEVIYTELNVIDILHSAKCLVECIIK